MPRKPAKPCRIPGCPQLTSVTDDVLCAPHRAQETRQYDAARGSPAQRGYGFRWRKLRRMVLASEPLCRVCGAPATEVDHILALARGGDDAMDNLQALCRPCHSRKTVREDGAWGGRGRQLPGRTGNTTEVAAKL